MSKFFVYRPVFAWVFAIVITLVGTLAVLSLPIGQYPSIAPPPISISVTYPGASAETVLKTVIAPIEEEMYGLDGLEYMSSDAQSDGSMQVTLTFKQGTNPDTAEVQVQNRLNVAEAMLPAEVIAQGLSITKATKSFMMIVAFISKDHSMDSQAIGDFLASKLEEPITRIPGIGDYTLFGSEYAMRIWLNPNALNSYGLTVDDVSNAIKAQNLQVTSGELGGLPSPGHQVLDATVVGPSRLSTPREFKQILLKVMPNGAQVRLEDVAKVELGAQVYEPDGLDNGQPTAGLGLNLAPGANQLEVAQKVHAMVDHLKPYFPKGLVAIYPYDTLPTVILSMHEVVETLLIAIVLVVIVMFVFLQNIRATLIPTLAVPVVLMGTFGMLAAFGFTLNTLTMLALVLAIGLLVDDAIVVVENVERLMHDEHLDPREATLKSMNQITGALVGIAMVLSVVFLPMAFFGGSAGIVYRQFSITIISAMALSVVVALTFTPSLCATILKPTHGKPKAAPFRAFNRGFGALVAWYGGVTRRIASTDLSWFPYLALSATAIWIFMTVPTGFMPEEDQGLIFVQLNTPPGSSGHLTEKVNADFRNYMLSAEKASVSDVLTVMGFNFGGRSQSAGFSVVQLKPFSQRTAASQSAAAITQRALEHFKNYEGARITPFLPPAVMELGNASGFDFELTNPGDIPYRDFVAQRDRLLAMARKDPRLRAVRANGLDDAPQWILDVEREKANALSVTNADINETIAAAFGSDYVNQFNLHGRTKKVFLEGQSSARQQPEDLDKWFIRNTKNEMVPLSAFITGHWKLGAQKLELYDGVPAFEIMGEPAPGYSTGQAMDIMDHYADMLPKSLSHEWTSVSFEQEQSSGQAGKLYLISLIVVLLCLAALYESWPIPLAVMLVVPLGILGAVLASWLRGLSNDIYFQVGLLTTVGLATKNAILIVEFAKEHYDSGASLIDAATHAARERLRPILMTSLAFILGTLPLATASGAGAGAHIAIGTAVVGGMTGSTVLAILFVPLFFVKILRLFKVRRKGLVETETRTDSHGLRHGAEA